MFNKKPFEFVICMVLANNFFFFFLNSTPISGVERIRIDIRYTVDTCWMKSLFVCILTKPLAMLRLVSSLTLTEALAMLRLVHR